ncbi:vicilin-like seed storage protein At2g18540 [Bombus pyrosoma]|uniref:vicilin-like seed storage protein At2g18540 n=1 Tax=Bombus pyrosoma TaxID=396416 RepID=UPI001CB8CB67|nr:vicilin-like seed storage protein At2g18540 [Bombus pyrosoma]
MEKADSHQTGKTQHMFIIQGCISHLEQGPPPLYVVRYEERSLESEKELVKECIKERERNWGNGQEGKRARRRKRELEEVRNGETQREEGGEQVSWTGDQIIEERRRRETEERRKRIRESKYNRYYRNIAKEERPKYLEGRMKWKVRRIIARFRCGNETKAKEHWKEEEERRCRLCGGEEEDLRHVLKECEITGGAKEMEEILNGTEEGLMDLRAIIEKRRAKAIQEGMEGQKGSTARRQKDQSDNNE